MLDANESQQKIAGPFLTFKSLSQSDFSHSTDLYRDNNAIQKQCSARDVQLVATNTRAVLTTAWSLKQHNTLKQHPPPV